MALALHRLTGSVVSRRGTYAKASLECVEEYLRTRWCIGPPPERFPAKRRPVAECYFVFSGDFHVERYV
jgi:hypothetical protein